MKIYIIISQIIFRSNIIVFQLLCNEYLKNTLRDYQCLYSDDVPSSYLFVRSTEHPGHGTSGASSSICEVQGRVLLTEDEDVTDYFIFSDTR